MYSNLIKLLLAVVVAIVVGFVGYPLGGVVAGLFRWRDDRLAAIQQQAEAARQARQQRLDEARKLAAQNRRQSTVIEDETAGDDWDAGFNDDDDDNGNSIADTTPDIDDDDYVDDGNGFAATDSFMIGDIKAKLHGISEDSNAPEIPGQTDVVPSSPNSGERAKMTAAANKLSRFLETEAKRNKEKTYRNDEFDQLAWKNPEKIYTTLVDRMMNALGKNPTPASIEQFLEKPANRLDLARYMLMRRTSLKGLERVAAVQLGTTMLTELSSDLDWLSNTMYSGPVDRLDEALRYLAIIYARYSEDMGDLTVRRIATTTALEFARERWPEEAMLARFEYYYQSYRQGRLNKIFDTLRYWETRIVTGNRGFNGWGSPQSLAWQRDNVRLPVEGYLGASGQLVYRLRNVAGDSVFANDYLAPVAKGMNYTTAREHREIGGVCGACSHFGAYGALASGLPAMTMGEPGHCAYTVRVGDTWRKGYSIYWQHGMHKTFWGMHDWEFLILTQELYSDAYKTLAADQFRAVAELLAARRMTAAAITCFDTAIYAQPLSWPNWLSFAGYMAQKAKDNKARWKELSERITDTLADRFHNVAATLQARYIYPQLLPLIPDFKERNRLFAAFFKKCKDYGIHTWDVAPLLNAQIAGCNSDKERLNYMKEVLPHLLDKPVYSGAVLAWGLDKVAHMDDANAAGGEVASTSNLQEEFSKVIMRAMKRMRSGKKDVDATWAGLGEAINTAATNGDTRTFQAIGKLAMTKCKQYFPKHRFKFRPFSGKVVSAKGLITTATTLDANGVKQSCLHWGVLQKTGGSIPIKFEGKSGITVKLEDVNNLTGVVALFGCNIKNDRPFHLETSEDGQNWVPLSAKAEISNHMMRFDLKHAQASGRFVRLLREGDKWDSGSIIGFYVYGKPRKS